MGLYSKSISQGELADGKLKKFMTLREATSSFKNIEDIIVFNMTGSELFFTKDWKVICTELRSNEVFIRNTTNGMILTKENIEFIVDNNLIQNLDISIDGAIKETFESIRVKIKYDKFIESINYLFSYIRKKKLAMDIGFNFCLMVDNWQELAMIPEIINKARGSEWEFGKVQLNVLVIDTRGEDSYLNFAKDHHHSLIPRNQFIEAVQKTKEECDLFKINLVWSYNEKIDEFIQRGAPQEGYENLSFVKIHLDSHLDDVDISSDSPLKFNGWVLSPNEINNISVRLNSKEVEYSYGRECQWLIEQYTSLKNTHCGLDFQVPHGLLALGNNLLEIEATDKEGFQTSKYVFLNKKAQ